MDFYTAIGLAGFLAYLISYTLLQTGAIDGNGAVYAMSNLAAASLVFVSLLDAFNLASALIQVSWILVSLFGIWRHVVASLSDGGTQPGAQQAEPIPVRIE